MKVKTSFRFEESVLFFLDSCSKELSVTRTEFLEFLINDLILNKDIDNAIPSIFSKRLLEKYNINFDEYKKRIQKIQDLKISKLRNPDIFSNAYNFPNIMKHLNNFVLKQTDFKFMTDYLTFAKEQTEIKENGIDVKKLNMLLSLNEIQLRNFIVCIEKDNRAFLSLPIEKFENILNQFLHTLYLPKDNIKELPIIKKVDLKKVKKK